MSLTREYFRYKNTVVFIPFCRDFAASRGTMLDDTSDGLSLLSGSQSMTSASDFSAAHSSLPPTSSARNNSRLSPVRESHTNEEKSTEVTPERMATSENIESYFEMVTTAPTGDSHPAPVKAPAFLNVPPSSFTSSATSPSSSMFARRPVPLIHASKSALTTMLAASNESTSENPFTELYSAISGRSDSDSMVVRVFFPHAREPAGQAMELNVRKDATIEEVLGFALWTYWEDGWAPKIDEGLEGEEDPKWAVTCSALGWILRIAEEDGEVDEDFPRKALPLLYGEHTYSFVQLLIVLERSQGSVSTHTPCSKHLPRKVYLPSLSCSIPLIVTPYSTTEQNHGIEDHTPSFAHSSQEEEIDRAIEECYPGCCWPRSAYGLGGYRNKRRPRVHARNVTWVLPQFFGAIFKSRTTSVPTDSDRRHSRCRTRLYDYSSVSRNSLGRVYNH